MSVSRTQAIILRRTNFGEADRVLSLLTPHGRMSVMARGVRREKSKLAGGIELFALSDITVHNGKGDLDILTSARLIHFYQHILEDYDRLQFGYEAIKTVSRASDQVDEAEWFDILLEVFKGLDASSVPRQLTEMWFYLQYARLTGYELSLERDVTGAKLVPTQRYIYDVSEKGLRASEQGELAAGHIKYLRLVATKSLAAVAQIGGVSEILPECCMLARQHASL